MVSCIITPLVNCPSGWLFLTLILIATFYKWRQGRPMSVNSWWNIKLVGKLDKISKEVNKLICLFWTNRDCAHCLSPNASTGELFICISIAFAFCAWSSSTNKGNKEQKHITKKLASFIISPLYISYGHFKTNYRPDSRHIFIDNYE